MCGTFLDSVDADARSHSIIVSGEKGDKGHMGPTGPMGSAGPMGPKGQPNPGVLSCVHKPDGNFTQERNPLFYSVQPPIHAHIGYGCF